MARSLKKGAFVDGHLMKKVEAANASGKKKSSKHGPAVPQFTHNSSVTHLRSIMAKNISQCMSLKIWSDTNSVNSLQPENTPVTLATLLKIKQRQPARNRR